MPRFLIIAVLITAVAGCTHTPSPAPRVQTTVIVPEVGRFSDAKPGDVLPSGWRVWTFSSLKKSTEYRLVVDGGRTVVKASAHGSASGLTFPLHIDTKTHPLLRWRWKVPQLIRSADNTQRHTEDSPVRLIVSFSGDVSKLPFNERLIAQQFKMFTQRELPYATLMYIWENRIPEGAVIANVHTSRIKMVVAETGQAGVGDWHEETRNVYQDYKRAFGEEPPPVKAVSIMMDTDNTGESVDAYYGDITFLREHEGADGR